MRTIRTPRKSARSAPTGQAEAQMASPLGTACPMPRPSRNAGSFRGGMSGYRVPGVATTENAAQERALIQSRSADLTANDWAASSAVNAITTNAVGQGLQPQSDLDWERLGISEQEALELQDAIERVWEDWVPTADVRGMMHFGDLQYLGLRSMLRQGELLHVPVMACDPLRPLSLAIQAVHPTRLMTPSDKRFSPSIRDGIEYDAAGSPSAYWLATPPPASLGSFVSPSSLTSRDFTRIPARLGHRPGVFHLFRHLDEEQERGVPVLSPGMNLFRHLSDSLDNELLSQVITSSLTMFIELDEGNNILPDYVHARRKSASEPPRYYQSVESGTIMYGNPNERPHMLETSSPSPNFEQFCRFVLRSMAASVDMPYEVIAKDFSQTNYSSARAAMLEAWKVFTLYRQWLVSHYCQPIFQMVIEEAWLRGKLQFPAKAPDFYDAPRLYSSALWIGPARGYVDPVKEVNAVCKEIDYGLKTRREALAERGRDLDSVVKQRKRESSLFAAPTTEKVQ